MGIGVGGVATLTAMDPQLAAWNGVGASADKKLAVGTAATTAEAQTEQSNQIAGDPP